MPFGRWHTQVCMAATNIIGYSIRLPEDATRSRRHGYYVNDDYIRCYHCQYVNVGHTSMVNGEEATVVIAVIVVTGRSDTPSLSSWKTLLTVIGVIP